MSGSEIDSVVKNVRTSFINCLGPEASGAGRQFIQYFLLFFTTESI